MIRTAIELALIATLLPGCLCIASDDESRDRSVCESIVIGKCTNSERGAAHVDNAKVKSTVTFRVCAILKGPPCATPLRITYDQGDPWSGSSSSPLTPKTGSKWILFIPFVTPKDGGYQTLRGSEGRVELSKSSLIAVLDDLEKHCLGLVFDETKRRKFMNEIDQMD